MEKQKLIKLLQLVRSYAEIQEMKKSESYKESVKERFNSLQKHEKEAFVELLKTWHAQHKIAKDDKPHAPNSPEDKAHDVVEEDESVKQALQHVKGKQGKKRALSHLRSLVDRSKHRSPKNQQLGKKEKKK